MFTYYFRLALKSLRRTPVVAALMIGAIALGVGVCITTLTVYRLMSGNPIEHRNDVLYSVTLDNWDPNQPWDDKQPELPPTDLTYRDAMALQESDIPVRHVAMRKGPFVVEGDPATGVKPFLIEARLTTKDFFPMFDVPFQYGGGWGADADRGSQRVVVLSKETNDKVFGGEDSVGRPVRLDGKDYKVIGVLAHWEVTPKFYDLNNGSFRDVEEAYVPFSVGIDDEVQSAGNINCWRAQPLNSFQDFLNSDCVWIQYWVELKDRNQAEAYQSFIDNYVREQKKLGRFERPLNNHLRHPDEWLKVNRVVERDNSVLVGLSFMFLAVCLLNMIGLLLAKFLGGAPLVGLRRALGATRKAVFQQHLIEVGVIGIAGGALGIGLAALGLLGVRRLYENYDALTHLDMTMALIALAIAIASGVLAGLYPTWRVCRVQPASYLKTQ
ncbi:MAG TPA: ABC transporter permease [Povalibacter sp.]|uniref:ABC transporter permease n=1 Tax=Povalibacter sp. TaxID=1962978 RepID=UPI002CAC53E8|nr:ABC transporter permease [Povalibacter sp.]HMN43916.1 ABC transporter permease [Povalibacter sp.]